MGYIFSILAMIIWGLSDLFIKKGSPVTDENSHWKFGTWIGLYAFAAFILFSTISDSDKSLLELYRDHLLFVLVPISFGLVSILTSIGYRFLKVSIYAPIGNASGAFAILLFLVYFLATGNMSGLWNNVTWFDALGTVLVFGGLIWLGFVQHRKKDEEYEDIPKKYRYGALALLFPIALAFFESLDTFASGVMLDKSNEESLSEIEFLTLYSSAFVVGIISWLSYAIKNRKKKLFYMPFRLSEWPWMAVCVCEFLAYLFYAFALKECPLFATAVTSSYCIVSMICGKFILGERLSKLEGRSIALILIGIVIFAVKAFIE